jgi:hypothetical protein
MGVIAKSAIPLFFTMNVSEQRSYKKKFKMGQPQPLHQSDAYGLERSYK